MSEADWQACGEPLEMLLFLRKQASDRQHRLFACACVRQVWPRLLDERSQRAVEVAERLADGLATPREARDALDAAERAADQVWEGRDRTASTDESAAPLLPAAEAAA